MYIVIKPKDISRLQSQDVLHYEEEFTFDGNIEVFGDREDHDGYISLFFAEHFPKKAHNGFINPLATYENLYKNNYKDFKDLGYLIFRYRLKTLDESGFGNIEFQGSGFWANAGIDPDIKFQTTGDTSLKLDIGSIQIEPNKESYYENESV